MNIASIDIGSNTVLLLIAEVNLETLKLKTLLDEYRIPRLSRNLQPGNPIQEAEINSLISILKEYDHLIKQFECEKIIVTGTNPFRIASNAKEIANTIKAKLNYNIKILDGHEEAYSSYLGSVSLEEHNVKNLVIDIGGGSTELCFGINNQLIFSKSYLAGAVSGYERFFAKGKSEKSIILFKEMLKELFSDKKISELIPDRTYASAGTPTTAACLILGLTEFRNDKIDGYKLYKKDLNGLVSMFMEHSPPEILNKFGEIIKGREDVLLPGMIILVFLMDLMGHDFITVTTKGLRYGTIIKEYL